MKILLHAFILLLACQTVFGQCTPDAQYTQPGIYPDSATGLAPAYVGLPYEQTITAVVPADTQVVIIPNLPAQTVTIDSIVVDQINGLPPGFDYICQTPSCGFPGGQSGCLKIFSTSNPALADTGRYYLDIQLTTYSVIQQTNNVGYYYIDIVDSANLSVGSFDGERIKMAQNAPNPVGDITYIDYVSGTNTTIDFKVSNLLGAVVYNKTIRANRGDNRIRFDASDLNSGIYLYTIDNGNITYGKKMIVR